MTSRALQDAANKKFGSLSCQGETIKDTDDPADICQRLNKWLDASHDTIFTYCTQGTVSVDLAAAPYVHTYRAYGCKPSNAALGIVGGGATGQAADPLCFSQDECASSDYGGSADAFVPSSICPSGQGRCLAPEPQITLSSPVLGVTTVQGLKYYIVLMFRFLLSIVVITAGVMFVYGGFKYILGATAGTIESAKETMVDATVGLIVTIAATMLLNTVNPATTNLNRLDIYLLKKQLYSNGDQWCREVQPSNGKTSIMFASAGVPSGSITFSDAKYTVSAAQTKCAQQYYPESYGGAMCNGDVCDGGKVCMSCKGLGSSLSAADAPDCSTNPKGTTCVNAMISGTINWDNETYPTNIWMVPFCYFAQPDVKDAKTGKAGVALKDWVPATVSDSQKSADMYPGFFSTKPQGKAGSTTYFFPSVSKQQLDTWASHCSDLGQIDGWLIGVNYHDNCSFLKTVTADSGPGWFNTMAQFGKGINCAISPDDYLLVSKNDCKGANPGNKAADSQKYFSAYINGDSRWTDSQKFSYALYCGYNVSPNPSVSWLSGCATNHRFDWVGEGPQNPWFSFQDVLHTVVNWGGDQKSLKCDFDLNWDTAPHDPSDVLLGQCSISGQWRTLDKPGKGDECPDFATRGGWH